MTTDRNAFQAGLFIVISIALIIMVTVLVKGVGHLTQPMIDRCANFKLSDNVGGLRIGDDVRVGGLKVGVVKSVDLMPQADGSQLVLVYFTFPGNIDLHKNAHLVVESTVTGTSDLNIDNLGDGALLAATEPLEGSPGAFTTLLASAQKILPDVRDVVNSVKTQTVPKINNTLDKFGGTADTGTQALAQIRDLFGDTGTDFRGTVKNLHSITGTVDQKIGPILEKVDTAMAKATDTIEGVRSMLGDIKKTVANTRDLTASVRSILVDNRGRIDGIIVSLKATSDNLKNASSEIRHNPWRLLYKPTSDEVANLNLYDSARQFSEGATSLSDAAAALRDALNDPNADKTKVQTLVDQLDKSFEKFNDVEADLWKNVKQ